MKIGMISKEIHARDVTRRLEKLGHEVVQLTGNPTSIPPSIEFVVVRSQSCSHNASSLGMEWWRQEGRRHRFIQSNSASAIVKAVEEAVACEADPTPAEDEGWVPAPPSRFARPSPVLAAEPASASPESPVLPPPPPFVSPPASPSPTLDSSRDFVPPAAGSSPPPARPPFFPKGFATRVEISSALPAAKPKPKAEAKPEARQEVQPVTNTLEDLEAAVRLLHGIMKDVSVRELHIVDAKVTFVRTIEETGSVNPKEA